MFENFLIVVNPHYPDATPQWDSHPTIIGRLFGNAALAAGGAKRRHLLNLFMKKRIIKKCLELLS